jgi:hypothetical protein
LRPVAEQKRVLDTPANRPQWRMGAAACMAAVQARPWAIETICAMAGSQSPPRSNATTPAKIAAAFA